MRTQEVRASETIDLGKDLSGEVAVEGGSGVSRRAFVGGMGAMMAAAAAVAAGGKTAFADEAAAEEAAAEETEADDAAAEATEEEVAEEEEAVEEAETETATTETYVNYPTIESTTGWTGTPEDVLALGISTMPLDDLNQYRQAYVDAQTDYTCEDGTVIPACYVKVRALINTYGQGCGNDMEDDDFAPIMDVFSEDDCQAFIDMPLGVEFTAYEMAEKTGRDVDECSEICERLAGEGFLCAFDANRGRTYKQVAYFQGVVEYGFTLGYETDWEDSHNPIASASASSGTNSGHATTGTPTFYFVPVDASVTSDGTILPFDDLKEKIKSQSCVCISPCTCRYSALIQTYGHENLPSFEDFQTGEYEDYFSDLCDQRVETCIQAGDEAAYWIAQGWGRQITGEQAAEYLQRSVDDGFMLETTFGKNSETICSCHIDSCGILSSWSAVGDAEDIAGCNAFKQVSHYTLEVDTDLCIGCGTCVDRCPIHCISINDEGWAESDVDCFRCGQCAYVCPQGARHLVQRDESELAPLPQGMTEDANVKAAYRFEMGLIPFPETSASTDETAEEAEEASSEEAEVAEEAATEEAVE